VARSTPRRGDRRLARTRHARRLERDRRRDAELLAKGWRVLRISWARLEREPEWVAERVREALRAQAA
jgi:very-short-patch-repair endonuclease